MIDTKILNNRNRRPSTPGEVLEDVLETNELSQVEFAKMLNISSRTVNRIIKGQRRVDADLAVRLGAVLGNGPELWLNLQQAVDVWDALEANRKEYEKLKPVKAA
jgi:addiction module HigA family antidote